METGKIAIMVSGEGYGCRWLLEEAGVDYVNVTLQLCADTICWTWGYLDENGKLMRLAETQRETINYWVILIMALCL